MGERHIPGGVYLPSIPREAYTGYTTHPPTQGGIYRVYHPPHRVLGGINRLKPPSLIGSWEA